MKKLLKKLSSARIIAIGFATLILLGSFLLCLPCCVKENVQLKYLDALFTSTSAVCVTGLVVCDTADTFTAFGQFIIGTLIQFGGLGVAAVGAGIILAVAKKLDIKSTSLIRESMNLSSGKGIAKFLISIFFITVIFELLGALFSFVVFIKDFPPLKAMGISLFHSVASFNNAGFDILGNYQNLIPYRSNILLNIITCALIYFGGIGFLLIREIIDKKFNWRKFSMHTKVVLSTSFILIVFGTLLIKFTENISWLGAVFTSISARTAGFSTYSLGDFTNAGLIVMALLMFIGASPGSTGGGIKTTTIFALLIGIKSSATNKTEKAFKYTMPSEAFRKAAIIVMMGLAVVICGTYLMLVFEPGIDFIDIFFEIVSAFGTVGLSTGITPTLTDPSKLLTIVIMFIGRLGPMTIATIWHFTKGERVKYPEGNIAIG